MEVALRKEAEKEQAGMGGGIPRGGGAEAKRLQGVKETAGKGGAQGRGDFPKV